MRWVSAKDLEQYSERRDCQENLPLIIRRLIRATINKISSISFPSGESIGYPGWDGRLESLEETEYIPKGLSLWEMGTSKDIRRKAEKDYRKRKQDPLGYNPSEAVFIFVTPRIWSGKERWLKEKKKEGLWKDVRVYDGRDLEEWLEQAPAVGAWLAKLIGKYPENITSLEDWWNEWSNVTRPPLITDLVLSGRNKEIEEIKKWLESSPSLKKEWLESPPSLKLVQSFTVDEAIAFLYAVISTLSENEREYFLSKSIIVEDEESLKHIVTTCKNDLILVPKFKEVESAVSYSNNHHIFIPLDPGDTTGKKNLVLSHIEREGFVNSLVKMGISKESAEKYFRDTAGILSILRRQLSPVSNKPEWAKPENARELIPILLVGKFNENKDDDKEIISEISEIPYDQYVTYLKKWEHSQDPPVLKIGEIWRLTSHIDSFYLISPFLTKEDFEKFGNVVLKVLREINPALDLEPEKRRIASLYGKLPKYSKELRKGIVETLILIAVFGDKINNGRGLDLPYTPQSWVDSLVAELLKDADWKLWYLLEDVLPLIAEASPLSFLDAVEDSLSQESPPIMGMFSETEDTSTSHSAHPSLLWALEGLAWDPNLLGRVTLILGKLAKLDPGGKLSNRPINSLRSIFLLRFPQTSASLGQRLKSLDLLIDKEPEIGWNLLINLLPREHDYIDDNYKPRWRQFSEKIEYQVSSKEYLESICEIVERAIKHAGTSGKRWSEVMEYFDNFPPQERKKVLSQLSESIASMDEGKLELWDSLRKILSRHRTSPDAEWALLESELVEIEKLYIKLEPDDIIKRCLWLFDDLPDLPEGKDLNDPRKFDQMVNQKRKEAMKSIWSNLGIDGITNLATQTKNPQFVGVTLAEISLTDQEEETLFSLLGTEDQKKILFLFVQTYLLQKSLRDRDYIDKIINDAMERDWSNRKIVNLFLALPQNRKVWDLLKKFDIRIQQEYWEKLDPRFYELKLEDKLYGLKQLIDVKRHFTALNVAASLKEEVPAKFIIELLEKTAMEKSIDNFTTESSRYITQLFEILDKNEEIERTEIAKLEFLYLPILANVGSSRPPKVLHQELANNPEFFATIIKWAYKPKNKDFDEEEKELSEEFKKRRAQRARELLDTWKIIPGSDDTGKIDYDKLKEWVDKARNICKERNRLEVCDGHIGQVFAHAMCDSNGNWPPEEICKIIEEVKSEKLDNGFFTGIRNKRGIVARSLFEGGKQERTLSEQYRRYSERLAHLYPRVSTILWKVAESYENQARFLDNESKKLEFND